MKIDKKDLELSYNYHSAIKEAEKQSNENINLFKKNHSNKIEAKLFLSNKDLINNMVRHKKLKGNYLYNFIKTRFNLKGPYLKLLILSLGYITIDLFVLLCSVLMVIIFGYLTSILNPSFFYFFSIFLTAFFSTLAIIFLWAVIFYNGYYS